MYDLKKSYFNDAKERAVAPAQSITEEAMCLAYVDDGAGGLAVQPTAGTSADIFAGFAITDAQKILTEVVVEQFNVPSTGPYTAQLKNGNLVTGEIRVVGSVFGAMTNDGLNATPTVSGHYGYTTAGLITFVSAQAGEKMTVTYRYNLTVAQSQDKFHVRSINNAAQDYFSTVTVGCLEGEIFTSMFDASKAYAVGNLVYTGAGGKVTTTSTSTVVVGYVSKVPSTSDAMLGVKFSKTA